MIEESLPSAATPDAALHSWTHIPPPLPKARLSQLLIAAAVLGILTRTYAIYVSAHQISIAHGILDGAPGALEAAVASDAEVGRAAILAVAAFAAYVAALITVRRRAREGDWLASAITEAPLVRYAGRIYLGGTAAEWLVQKVLFASDENTAPHQVIHRIIDTDYASMVLNAAVVVFLLVVAVAARRAMVRARAAGVTA